MQNVLSFTTYECSQVSLPGNLAMAAFDVAAASRSSPAAMLWTPGRVRSITNRFIAFLRQVGEAQLSARTWRPGSGINANLPWQSCHVVAEAQIAGMVFAR